MIRVRWDINVTSFKKSNLLESKTSDKEVTFESEIKLRIGNETTVRRICGLGGLEGERGG